MSDLPKKKLKQVCLPFSMTPSTKKRKLEDEVVNVDLVKLRKIHDETKNEQEPNGDDSNDASKENESDLSFDASESVNNSFEKSKSLDSLSKKKLTPKQLAKKQESEARRLERERIKQEKERKKREEKEMKEKKRLAEIEAKNEEKRQREEEKRIREEERKAKEEEKRKQREEEKRIKEEERKAKEEEKKAKEEERKAKEEERKQKLEEKQKKEELERKNKEKIAAAFTNFFLKSSQTKNVSEIVEKPESSRFMPFEVKADMKVAEIHRATLTAEQKAYLDQILQDNVELDVSSLYLAQLKTTDYKPGHSENTWPLNVNDDEDDIRNDGGPGNYVRTRYRGKLFQFAENRRPAYWGTWRKRSKSISGRNPFKCDTEFFEYDIDSDEEWVEEPGESLHGSDDEKESDNEYEVDNDFFVPHGYLSDEEAQDNDDDDVKNKSPNSQKIKLNILEKEFEAELNEKTRKLKPRYYGCIWIPNNIEKRGVDEVEDLLLSFRAQWNDEQTPFCLKTESLSPSTQSTPSSKTKASSEFPEQFIPDLIKLVHGNKNRAKNIVKEFISYVLSKDSNINLTSVCVKKRMKEISSWHITACYWYVNDDIRACHNLADLSPLDNDWKYVTTVCTQFPTKKVPKQNEKLPLATLIPQTSTMPVAKHSSIDKFVKVLTAEEKERQLKAAVAEKKSETAKPLPPTCIPNEQKRKDNFEGEKPVKKRAVLFTMNKDKMWTSKTESKSSKTTVPESFQENDLNASKSAGETALCKHDPDVKKLSNENVTVTKSTQDIQDKNTNVQFETPTLLNCNVPLNGSSSTTVTTDTGVGEEIKTEKKLTDSNDTGSDSINTSINESKDVRVDLKPQVPDSKITIRKGKKYATLITVTKVRD